MQKIENFNKKQVSALDKCVLQKEFSNVIKLFLCRWKIWSSASGLSSAEEDIIGINVLKLFWKLDCEMSIMTDQFCRNMIFLSFFSYLSHSKSFLISGIHCVCFWSIEIPKIVFATFDNVIFHVYLMSGLQKNAKKKSRWLFEIIHIIRFEIWDLEIWKKFWDIISTI